MSKYILKSKIRQITKRQAFVECRAKKRKFTLVKVLNSKRPRVNIPLPERAILQGPVSSLPAENVVRAVGLLKKGLTLPFVARYRQGGGLNDEALIAVGREWEKQLSIYRRKQEISELVHKSVHGDLVTQKNSEFVKKLRKLPLTVYSRRVKRKMFSSCDTNTRDVEMLLGDPSVSLETVEEFLNDLQEKGGSLQVITPATREIARRVVECVGQKDGISNCQVLDLADRENVISIIADEIYRFPGLRVSLGSNNRSRMSVRTELVGESQKVPAHYFPFFSLMIDIRAHQWLAIRRFERQGILRVILETSNQKDSSENAVETAWLGETIDSNELEDEILEKLSQGWAGEGTAGYPAFVPVNKCPCCFEIFGSGLSKSVVTLRSAFDRDSRKFLDESAERSALDMYRRNLRQKLHVSGINPPKVVLAVDPGIAKGHKCAIVDERGNLLNTFVLRNDISELLEQITKWRVEVVAIGNGLGGDSVLSDLIAKLCVKQNILLCRIDECGASSFSASANGLRDLPSVHVLLRGAVSLARRLIDPLSEFAKIGPSNLGVGLYQKDIPEERLSRELDAAFEWLVSEEGVDVNTACIDLLVRVPGMTQLMAEKIIELRESLPGCRIANRREMRSILSETEWQAVVGFLKIKEHTLSESSYTDDINMLNSSSSSSDRGWNPFDGTLIHPEFYELAGKIQQSLSKFSSSQADKVDVPSLLSSSCSSQLVASIAKELISGSHRHPPIVKLYKYPYEELVPQVLKVGSEILGKVQNVVDFGIFIDIGSKRAALLHSSRYPDWSECPKIGDDLKVTVLSIQDESGKIEVAFLV